MCYENVHKGEVCHRRWAADWFLAEHGLIVPEVSPLPKGHTYLNEIVIPEDPPLSLF